MTKERMVELLKIEKECVTRASKDICDRQCDKCELVQDDKELLTMYEKVISLMIRIRNTDYDEEKTL